MRLEAETEARRTCSHPARERLRRRRAVEAAVQLHAVETLRVVGQHLGGRQPVGIEHAPPARVAEARRAGEQPAYVRSMTRALSCPQAASAARPRVSRSVTF